MREQLVQHVGSGGTVHLTMQTPCEPTLNGYLLDMSETLVLMHSFDDFDPDGYTVIRIEDVTDLRRSPFEEWWDHMVAAEGLLGGLENPPRVDLTDMRSAIESIAAQYDQMIVECEEADDERFYIGKLVEAGDEEISFRSYDALGYWDKEPEAIRIDEITKLQCDTPYIRIFSKYTREGRPPDFPEYGD